MDLFLVTLLLITSLSGAFWNLWLKRIINAGADHRSAYYLSNCIGLIIFGIPALIALRHSSIDKTGLMFAFVTGILFAVQNIFITVLYKFDDLSRAYPLMKTRPIFAFIFGAVVLNERPSSLEIAGIVVVCLGSYMMNLESFGLKDILKPKMRWSTVMIAGASAALGALYGLTTKMGSPHIYPLVFAYIAYTVSVITVTPLVYRCGMDLGREIRRYWKYFTAISICDFTSFSIVAFVLIAGKLSSISALQQSSILFATLLGVLILGERHANMRIPASIVIMLGLVLVTIGGT